MADLTSELRVHDNAYFGVSRVSVQHATTTSGHAQCSHFHSSRVLQQLSWPFASALCFHELETPTVHMKTIFKSQHKFWFWFWLNCV
jgi:hypothetical protein